MNTQLSNENILKLSNELFSEILLEQRKITKIEKSHPDKKDEYQKILKHFGEVRGRPLFYPYISNGKGHGPFTELIDGSVKYDLIGGIGPNLLGHSHPLYIKGQLEAALYDSVMCGNLLPYQPALELSDRLIKSVSDSRLKHFWFTGSGSFANDTAIKIAWQKRAPNHRIIAFKNAFAGRSIATQEITDNPNYRDGMPEYLQIDHVPHFNGEDSIETTLIELEKLWKKHDGKYAAIMIELIQGEAGFVYGDPEYYKTIFEWARKNGLIIIVDEVQTFGRTTELFAFQHFGLDEYVDIVTVGKALQACGLLYTEDVNPRPGLISGTFNGSLSSIITGNKIVNYLLEGNFYGQNGRLKELETIFLNRLNKLMTGDCKNKITYCGGVGAMISFEVFSADKDKSKEFLFKLLENGVIAFSAGKDRPRVRFLLPLSLTNEHIDEIFEIISTTLKEME